MDNRLDVMTKTFLGLTVACARCHDHKFDAISQRDYYALSGFLDQQRLPPGPVRVDSSASARPPNRSRPSATRRGRACSRSRPAPRGRASTGMADDLLAARSLLVDGEFHGGRARPLPNLGRRAGAGAGPTATIRSMRSRSSHCDPNALDARSIAGANQVAAPTRRRRRRRAGRSSITRKVAALARLQDGFAFGLRPVRPGDLRLVADGKTTPTRPLRDGRGASRPGLPVARRLRGDRARPRPARDVGPLRADAPDARVHDRIGPALVPRPGRGAGLRGGQLAPADRRAAPRQGPHRMDRRPQRLALGPSRPYRLPGPPRRTSSSRPTGAGELEIARVVESDQEPRRRSTGSSPAGSWPRRRSNLPEGLAKRVPGPLLRDGPPDGDRRAGGFRRRVDVRPAGRLDRPKPRAVRPDDDRDRPGRPCSTRRRGSGRPRSRSRGQLAGPRRRWPRR